MNFIDKNRNYLLYSLVLLLFSISASLAYTTSAELSKYFGYTDLNTIFIKQLVPIVIGFSLMYLISRLDVKIWFNRIGVTIFITSILLLITMLFAPNSITASVSSQKLYLVLGGFSIEPMVFFAIGVVWFISWINGMQEENKFTNLTIFILMIITAYFCTKFNDIRTLLMLEILFITMLIYINGINKVTIVSFLSFIGIGILFILMAEHRIMRIKSWFESSPDFMTDLAIDSTLHENILLTLIDTLGAFTFIVVLLLFLLICYIILKYNYKNKSNKIFAVGIVILILIDLTLNVFYTFGLLPIYPPPMYLFGYGNSVVVTSFVMMGMLVIKEKNHERI